MKKLCRLLGGAAGETRSAPLPFLLPRPLSGM
jgi:hypothetical protein